MCLLLSDILFQDFQFTQLNLHSFEVDQLHADWRNTEDVCFLDLLSHAPVILSWEMSRAVCSSEIDNGHFLLKEIKLVFLIYLIVCDKLRHWHSFDLDLPSERFQLKGVLISEVKFFLVFFMNDHQRDSPDAFFFQG